MATGGRPIRGYEDDDRLLVQFQQLSVRPSDLLNLQCHMDVNMSRLTATISWTYRGNRTKVNSWKLRVRNLTWEQNDYDYDKKVFPLDRDMNEHQLPLWFRPGNRYEVILFGLQHTASGEKVICENSIEFRTGEVLSKRDVVRLQEAAELYNARPSTYADALCTFLYRNKPKEYFDTILTVRNGIMETYLKDASGDLRSPINGEISGLFFLATVNRDGEPFTSSPFGDTRILIRTKEVLKLTPNMFFADFHCMQNKQDIHHVTIVLTKPGSSADQFCNRCLPRLDVNCNPFLYKQANHIWVSTAVFVDVFVTEDLDVTSMIDRGVAEFEYPVQTRGLGKTSQGGQYGVKSACCEHCDIFFSRPLANYPGIYEVY